MKRMLQLVQFDGLAIQDPAPPVNHSVLHELDTQPMYVSVVQVLRGYTSWRVQQCKAASDEVWSEREREMHLAVGT